MPWPILSVGPYGRGKEIMVRFGKCFIGYVSFFVFSLCNSLRLLRRRWRGLERRQVRKPDPIKPDPIKPDPIKPDPIKPDPIKQDPIKQDPMATMGSGGSTA
jgi:hypothetical protein